MNLSGVVQVGGTFWLTRLARDSEATVRLAALSLLAHLAAPTATPTRRMLLQGWPEAGTAVLKVDNSPLQFCPQHMLMNTAQQASHVSQAV